MATRKCCGCKERFDAETMIKKPVGWFHSVDCMIGYARSKGKAKLDKQQRAKHRQAKAKLKPKSAHLAEAQAAFNEWIRYRDADKHCINTGQAVSWNGNDSDAAHFVSRGANPAMRFDLRNVHKATKASNKNQDKYIHDYRENLIARLGANRFEQFEADCRHWRKTKRTFNIEYLERVKRIFRKKKRVVMKIREAKK